MVQNFNYLVINCVKFLLFSNGQMQAWGVQDIIVWAGCKAQIAEIATQFSKVGVVNHSLLYLKIFVCCWGEGVLASEFEFISYHGSSILVFSSNNTY